MHLCVLKKIGSNSGNMDYFLDNPILLATTNTNVHNTLNNAIYD